jgi:hypothetical protein
MGMDDQYKALAINCLGILIEQRRQLDLAIQALQNDIKRTNDESSKAEGPANTGSGVNAPMSGDTR